MNNLLITERKWYLITIWKMDKRMYYSYEICMTIIYDMIWLLLWIWKFMIAHMLYTFLYICINLEEEELFWMFRIWKLNCLVYYVKEIGYGEIN